MIIKTFLLNRERAKYNIIVRFKEMPNCKRNKTIKLNDEEPKELYNRLARRILYVFCQRCRIHNGLGQKLKTSREIIHVYRNIGH